MTLISVGGAVMSAKYPIIAFGGVLLTAGGIHFKMVLIFLNDEKQLIVT